MTLLSMNEITTYRWSLVQDVENYREAGYSGIGMWRHKIADENEDHVIDLLTTSGLSVTSLSWAGGFTGSDGRGLNESIEDAVEAVRLAAAIMARCLVIYSGGRNNHTFRHAGRLLRTALEELLPLAETWDVPLAIEPMHAACATDWTFLTSLESAIGLVEEFDSPYLKIAYDTYHFPLGIRRRYLLSHLAPYLGVVFLSDRVQPASVEQERCQLGQGRLPLVEIVSALQEAGYAGAYDVKLMGPDIETCDYWTLLEQSHLAFNELVPAAVHRSLA
ncbi:MAG TPA: sugar phosphate isomerase/epimerase family protein [Lacipirellulaceae bacterium]|nr:sugar phosphate isomerase/epimerase family protein [Lacipirellulaceae bacterium]